MNHKPRHPYMCLTCVMIVPCIMIQSVTRLTIHMSDEDYDSYMSIGSIITHVRHIYMGDVAYDSYVSLGEPIYTYES